MELLRLHLLRLTLLRCNSAFYSEYFNETGRHPYVRIITHTPVCRTLRAAVSHADASPRRVLPCVLLRCSTGLLSAPGPYIRVSLHSPLILFSVQFTG